MILAGPELTTRRDHGPWSRRSGRLAVGMGHSSANSVSRLNDRLSRAWHVDCLSIAVPTLDDAFAWGVAELSTRRCDRAFAGPFQPRPVSQFPRAR